MLKKIISALLAAFMLTCVSFAESYTASSIERLHDQLSKARSGDSVSVFKGYFDNVGFTVNEGVSLSSDSYTPGAVSLTEKARVTNFGTINQNSVLFSSGAPSLENFGRLYITEIPRGATVSNHGWVMASGGLDLKGTFILENGGTLNFSTSSVTGSKSLVKMSLGSRFVNKTNKNHTAVLPDGSTVNIWKNTDFTVIKPRPPKIYLEDTGAAGQRLLTITAPDAGATIYFTIDGSTPDAKSAIYQRSVYVSSNARVQACARLTNSLMSDIVDSSSPSAPAPAVTEPVPPAPEQESVSAAKVNPPVINISGGSYPCRQLLSLSCSTQGAEIRYTTDGSTPTKTSKLYTGQFDIVKSCTVKAIAFKSDMEPSSVLTEHYQLSGYTVAQIDYSNPAALSSFWSGCVNRITSSSGKTVTANAGDCPYLANTVIKALNDNPTVSLTITRTGGKTITIPAGKAPKDFDPATRVWYSLDSLSAAFG